MMLQACFVFFALALVIVVYMMAVNVSLIAIADTRTQKRFIQGTGMVLVAWVIYISAISVTGIFENASMPPRIPLLLVAPAFLFFAYFFTNKRFKTIIDHTPHNWPVFFQSFRIIVDILIGLTAPLIAFFTFLKPKIGKSLFILWNIAGLATLAIVVLILMRHAYFLPNDSQSILMKGFGDFPYTFLAGLFMPLAVFMHIFSLVKAVRKPIE